jgi:hypothetical protein
VLNKINPPEDSVVLHADCHLVEELEEEEEDGQVEGGGDGAANAPEPVTTKIKNSTSSG